MRREDKEWLDECTRRRETDAMGHEDLALEGWYEFQIE